MPAWVKTAKQEKAWKKAKRIVMEQRDKTEDELADRDWGLVTHIAQNILKSSLSPIPVDEPTQVLLAHVELLLEARGKRDKKKRDDALPDDARVLVAALKTMMSVGGQAISQLRKAKSTKMKAEDAERVASSITAAAQSVQKVLEKLK